MGKKPIRACTIEAPCKINLHLHIGAKRSDGYHELKSLFVPLTLSDTLRFECSGEEGESRLKINQEAPGEAILEENNLVTKAVSLFREQTGYKAALRIRLDKCIPAGAGLGGGSSDAAACLLALRLLSGSSLPMEKLNEMALLLGSDVPFFLSGGAGLVGGRGELVKPVKSPQGLWVVLAKPPFNSETAFAYRFLDQVKKRGQKEELQDEALIKALEKAPETWPFYNSFLPVFLEAKEGELGIKAGAYRTLLEAFRGANASFSGLSGSGSSCFGIFPAKKEAEKAEKVLKVNGNYVKLTFFLARRANPVLEY